MGFTNVFGGNAIVSANPSYSALTIAVTTTLAWPIETVEGNPYVASQIDLNATASGLLLLMPSALQASTGVVSIITNVGNNSFIVADNTGAIIASIAPGQAYIFTLTTNATQAGTWRTTIIGATLSAPAAAAMAGNGLLALNGQLEVNWPTTSKAVNYTILAADRASVVSWTAVSGTFTFDTIANLVAGFICGVINNGTGNLIVQGSSGQLINGNVSVTLVPGTSILVTAAATSFNALGMQAYPLPIAAGGTGAITASAALMALGASNIGTSIFTAANAAAINALLGFAGGTPAFNTITASTAQAINATFSYNIMVCTAALTATLPLASTLSSTFCLIIDAQGGAVTVTPNVADNFIGMAANTPFVVGAGGICLLTTKAAGVWYPLILAPGVLSPSSSATITLTPFDRIVNIITASTAVAANLPATGGPFTIVDVSLNAATHNITVTPPSGLINGAATLVMRTNGASITTAPAGANWSVS